MALLRSSAFRILFFASLGAFALLSIPVNSATLSYRWPWTGVYQIGVVLSLLGALVSLKRGSTSGMNWRSGYTLSIIALVAAMTLATGFSDSPHRSAFSLLIPVGALGIGLMTFRFVRDLDNPATGLPRILGCLSLLSIFICGYSLLPLDRFRLPSPPSISESIQHHRGRRNSACHPIFQTERPPFWTREFHGRIQRSSITPNNRPGPRGRKEMASAFLDCRRPPFCHSSKQWKSRRIPRRSGGALRRNYSLLFR